MSQNKSSKKKTILEVIFGGFVMAIYAQYGVQAPKTTRITKKNVLKQDHPTPVLY